MSGFWHERMDRLGGDSSGDGSLVRASSSTGGDLTRSVQVRDFNRAGEDALIMKASYDFTRLGLQGVTAYALFVHGWGRVDPTTKASVPDENEFDADIQWRPQWKFLKGLWFRVRYAIVHQYERPNDTINDFRVIVNYDLALL